MTPTSKFECIAILNEYRDRLTAEQYRDIERAIGHLAIDGMYLDREAIDRLFRLSIGEITEDQAMAEILGKPQ
ncbi:MAG: antitoxin VbhA family protein [Sulfuricurvum sp.]